MISIEHLMIFTGVMGIVAFVSTVMLLCNDSKYGGVLFVTSISLCLISFIFGVIASYKLENQTWIIKKEPYKAQNIVALGDNNSLEGRFYARRGYIGENLYYQYMVERENGGFVAGKVKANDAVLYYTDDDFRVEWYVLHKEWWIFGEERDGYAKIYIPEGSISSEFNVDLE